MYRYPRVPCVPCVSRLPPVSFYGIPGVFLPVPVFRFTGKTTTEGDSRAFRAFSVNHGAQMDVIRR
jgi:hypothetical protein